MNFQEMHKRNELEPRALYHITMSIDGKQMAWTHIVPEDVPKNVIGSVPSQSRVELRPLKKGDISQLWLFRFENTEPGPAYNILSRLDQNESDPNSPVQIVNLNYNFAADGDQKFHEKYNRITVGLNQPTTNTFWIIKRQNDSSYEFKSMLGTAEHINPTGGANSWKEERVLDVVQSADGPHMRHRLPAEAKMKGWVLDKVGYL